MKPGEYFYALWGYDQTNVDYIVVASVSPSGKTALCRRASATHIANAGQQDAIMPGPAYGPVFRLHIRPGVLHDEMLVGSYPFVEGSNTYGQFYPVALGDVHYETKAEFGH